MKELHLSPRLKCIAACVSEGARLADVGTDHGYLPAYLLARGRIKSAVASDINAGPLARAKRTAQEYELGGRIDFRLCDGLRAISPDEADTIVIAGMGGETIVSILSAAEWTRASGITLLLQPMTKLAYLRRWLSENGYRIEREQLARERETDYVVMTVRAGESAPLTEADCEAGAAFGADPRYGAYLDGILRKLRLQREGLGNTKRPDAAARIESLRALEREIMEKRKEWERAEGV